MIQTNKQACFFWTEVNSIIVVKYSVDNTAKRLNNLI